MFHIDEQYSCPTTKEHIYMQRAIFPQITKDKRFVFKYNFTIMPYYDITLLLLELVAVASNLCYCRYIDKIDTNFILLLSSIPCHWDDGTLSGYLPILTFPCLWLGSITTIASDFLSGGQADKILHMMVITI
jgi:hypothetical protein